MILFEISSDSDRENSDEEVKEIFMNKILMTKIWKILILLLKIYIYIYIYIYINQNIYNYK